MRLGLIIFTLVAYVEATGNMAQCPDGCFCQVASSDTQLYVDCGHGIPDIDEERLSHQLDLMLSADHFIQHLTSLSIINTPLTHFPASVCKLVNLTSLNLNNNINITKLPDNCFTKLTKLVTLSMTRNSVMGLQDGLFDGLQSLVSLDLAFNQIHFIGLRVFSNSSDLTSLRSINLAFNKLTSLEPWFYYRCILGEETSPVNIDLRQNLISHFTNKLKFKYRCGMKRIYGSLNLYKNRMRHIMDMFNGWNLRSGSVYTTLICLSNLQGTKWLMKFYFGGLTYDCDCTDFPIYKLVALTPRNNILNNVHCNSENVNTAFGVKSVRALRALSIPLNEFVCELSHRCPSSCRCVYRPENATLHVYCSSTKLSSLPLDLPPLPKSYVRYKLDFSNNKLRRLEHRPYFVNTSVLDVSNCSLTEINTEVLKDVSHFSLVNLRGNMLQSFPIQAGTVNISARLLLSGNPWKCSCENSWMIGWCQSLSHQISDPGDIICRSPSRMYGRNMLKSTKEDFCIDSTKRYLIIIVSLSVAVATIVLLVIAGLLFYKLRLKFYKKWKFHPFDRDECVGEDMDYDVFLCCSSEDGSPHGRRILELVESNGYRVCYHERDFLPGRLIVDNIALSIERNKRTVCLLSTNFLRR